ncbi:MAG: hypothetical protein LBQ88_14085 [Treponema sp.]|jgi:hypothetical protein|nr:hypothetical protein [Treponema sp.]
MAAGELFETDELKQCRSPLTRADREEAVRGIINLARHGAKYFYTLNQAAAALHCTYDEILTAISMYRLDAVLFLSAYRVLWSDLCGYLLDWDDDLEEALDEYLRTIARRPITSPKSA